MSLLTNVQPCSQLRLRSREGGLEFNGERQCASVLVNYHLVRICQTARLAVDQSRQDATARLLFYDYGNSNGHQSTLRYRARSQQCSIQRMRQEAPRPVELHARQSTSVRSSVDRLNRTPKHFSNFGRCQHRGHAFLSP